MDEQLPDIAKISRADSTGPRYTALRRIVSSPTGPYLPPVPTLDQESINRVRAKAKAMPQDAELATFAKAVLWDVAERSRDPRDRLAAAKAIIDATAGKRGQTEGEDESDLATLPTDRLRAMRAEKRGASQ